ncbi:MAG: hypothetical protein JNM94_07025 [Phycisphaerae bacterium]|nr:hypothetical protein [Phycisphaerae bacterium]
MTFDPASQIPAPAPTTRPLFQWDRLLDPGWPFVLAGLALLVAGIIIPAQRELHDLRNEWRKVEAEETRMYGRLQAYDQFLSELRSGDPQLVRRLASAQLNRVPEGEEPLLLTPGVNHTVAQWIDESVPTPTITPDPYPDTLLSRLATGPNRLWLLASSVFLLFVGLLLAPDNGGRRMPNGRPARDDDFPASDGVAPGVATATCAASGASMRELVAGRVVEMGEEGIPPTVDVDPSAASDRGVLVVEETDETEDDDIIDVELVTSDDVIARTDSRADAWPEVVDGDDAAEDPVATVALEMPAVSADAFHTAPSDGGDTPSREVSAYDDLVTGPDTERVEPARHGAD